MAASDYAGEYSALYATDADGGDSADLATTVRATRPAGRQDFAYVQLSMSASAATAVVVVVLYNGARAASAPTTGFLIGTTPPQTATATAYRESSSGDYRAGILKFDLLGAPHYEVRVADPSSGTADIRTWTGPGTPS